MYKCMCVCMSRERTTPNPVRVQLCVPSCVGSNDGKTPSIYICKYVYIYIYIYIYACVCVCQERGQRRFVSVFNCVSPHVLDRTTARRPSYIYVNTYTYIYIYIYACVCVSKERTTPIRVRVQLCVPFSVASQDGKTPFLCGMDLLGAQVQLQR